MAILKPQTPLRNGEDFIYPVTTADQIILSDGTRLEKNGQLAVGGGGGAGSTDLRLPNPTKEDAGKFLRVDASGTSYVLEAIAVAEEAEF